MDNMDDFHRPSRWRRLVNSAATQKIRPQARSTAGNVTHGQETVTYVREYVAVLMAVKLNFSKVNLVRAIAIFPSTPSKPPMVTLVYVC